MTVTLVKKFGADGKSFEGQQFGLIYTHFFLYKGIKETALHLAVRLEERSSLALVDFLCQNRSDTDK